MGKTEEATKIVDNLIKAQPDNWLTLDLKGWVLREQGKYDEAVKVYEDVLARLPNDKRLTKEQKEDFAADIRYTLSGVYVEMKKIDKAAEQCGRCWSRSRTIRRTTTTSASSGPITT